MARDVDPSGAVASPRPRTSLRRRALVVAAMAAVLACAEGASAAAAGVDEHAFLLAQGVFALALVAALFLLPLPARWLPVLPPWILGAGHVLQAATTSGRPFGLVAGTALAIHLALAGAGFAWLFARARGRADSPAWSSDLRALTVYSAAVLAQSLACGVLLVPQLHAPSDGGLAWALACATLTPLGAAAAMLAALRWRGLAPGAVGPWAAVLPAALLAAAAGLPIALRWPWLMAAHTRLPEPGPAAAGLPDVVLLVLDTTRADRLSLYGHDRPTTPRLEAFASRATVYTDAVSPAVWTLPGHASIFTGLYPSEHRADHTRPLAAEAVTLAEWFRAAGYRTASFASNQMFRESAHYGLTQGFEVAWCEMPLCSRLLVPRAAFWILRQLVPRLPAAARQPLVAFARPFIPLLRETQPQAREVVRPALAWLDSVGERAPRLLFVNLMEAHGMQRAHDCGAQRFGEGQPFSPYQVAHFREVEAGLRDAAPGELERLRDWYDTSLACLDLHIGEFLDSLRRRGILDRALVAVVADHGEMLGDQRAFGHRGEVWQGLVHVPLLLKLPGQVQGSLCDHPTDTSALSAVLPALAGVQPLQRVPAWAGDAAWVPDFVSDLLLGREPSGAVQGPGPAPCPLAQRREHPLSIAGPSIDAAHDLGDRYRQGWIAVRDGTLKLAENAAGARWVADLASAAGEVPLPPDPSQARRLEALLQEWRAQELDLRSASGSAGREDDAEQEAARQRVLRQLGYVEGSADGERR